MKYSSERREKDKKVRKNVGKAKERTLVGVTQYGLICFFLTSYCIPGNI